MTVLDLRLLPAAVALWVGCAIGLNTGLRYPSLMVTALCAVAAVIAARQHHMSAAWLVSLGVGVLLAALRVDAAAPDAVARVLANSGAVDVTLVIDAEPMARERTGFGGLAVEPVMTARATLITLRTGTELWHTSLPVTLQWAPDGQRHAVGEYVHGRSVPRPGDPATRSAYWIRIHGPLKTLRPPSRGAHLASLVRGSLSQVTHAVSQGDGASLLPGLVLGDTRAQSEMLVDDLRVSGLSHLTAVSGANLAIVLGALVGVLRRTAIPSRRRTWLLLVGILAFVIVVQPQPSVLRAAVMGAIAVLAMATGSRRAGASLLWLSVVLLLVIDPFLAWQWGFGLSVTATGGLIVLGPQLHRAFGTGPVAAVLAVTLSAQLATFPLLLAMGRPPTWLSVPANLICEPLVAPATVLGFIAALLASAALIPIPFVSAALFHLATALVWPAVRIADLVAWIAHRGVSTPLAVAPVASWPGFAAVVLCSVLLLRFRVRAKGFVVLAVLAMLLGSCLPNGLRAWPQKDWWYAVCDVGQGDSSVLNLGDGRALVFDVGPDADAERRCLRELGVTHIEALVFTHFHADHVEGVRGALQQASVRAVFGSAVHEPKMEWQRVRAAVDQEIIDLQRGSAWELAHLRITVLWPDPQQVSGDPNNGSLVLDILRDDGARVLATGDADPAAQSAIRLPASNYTVLKVPHHGSRFQDVAFLQQVHARLAVISVGAGNDYGHPAVNTLADLRATGARVLRTDMNGTIAVSVRRGRVSYSAQSS